MRVEARPNAASYFDVWTFIVIDSFSYIATNDDDLSRVCTSMDFLLFVYTYNCIWLSVYDVRFDINRWCNVQSSSYDEFRT